MIIYFFGSIGCDQCSALLKNIKNEHIALRKSDKFIYINAFAEEKQGVCDIHKVDDLPQVDIYNDEGKLVFRKIGLFDVKRLWEVIYPDENERKSVKEKIKI
jgi:hypothetical protein